MYGTNRMLRGVNEIGTCVFKHLEFFFKTADDFKI